MKTLTRALAATALTFVSTGVLFADEAADGEAAAVKAAVQTGYVEGIWLEGDVEKVRTGFDSAFAMQVAGDEGVRTVTLDQWLERLGLNGEPLGEGISHEIHLLHQTGSAAVVRVEVLRDGEPVYTDYLSLYRTDEGWRIVTKIFHTHQEE